MNIGEKIRKLRKDNNLTLKELSKKSGLSISFISDIENGRRKPRLDSLEKLANALNVNPTVFLAENKQNDNYISNPDIRAIARAGRKMTPEEAAELKRLAERLFPNAFKEGNN